MDVYNSRTELRDIVGVIDRLRGWGEAREWLGYDPYDALTSPFAPLLTAGRPFPRRVLTQIVKRSPVNLRPLLRVPKALEPKAIALITSAYANLAAAGDSAAADAAKRWAEWLVGHAVRFDRELGWGYHFDVQTRVFYYAVGTPNTIATSFAAHALLDDFELCGHQKSADAALAAARFLSTTMLAGGRYFRYVPGEPELVHNANVLASSVLARAGALLGYTELTRRAAAALEVTIASQNANGSWPYSESHPWVDNFHTGYVLEGLATCLKAGVGVGEALIHGLEYWAADLFLEDMTPKYFSNRLYPIDAHCYATAIDTWLAVRDLHPGALERAETLARLLASDMLDDDGYVRFQRWRYWRNNVPFVRWTTAPSFRALSRLLLAVSG